MYSNQKLKPLPAKNKQQSFRTDAGKQTELGKGILPTPPKVSSSKNTSKAVKQQSKVEKVVPKFERSRTATQVRIDPFDYEDDLNDMSQLDDNNYFEKQLQTNIKIEVETKSSKPIAKNQIVLPKLDSSIKVKPSLQLQKQLDMELSRVQFDQESTLKKYE